MECIATKAEIRALSKKLRAESKSIALVPTMGFLHEGHLSLIRIAKKEADFVIVSRFVNPTQFAPNEDLDAYPSDRAHDIKLTQEAGADVLFEPQSAEIYAQNHMTWVEVPSMSRFLCGETRPTHFRGVCTILAKLFNVIQPDVAVFGEKDWQQLTIIRQMVKDLDMPVRIIGGALIREADGLAMSSRNAYLTSEERARVPHIQKGLLLLAENVRSGEESVVALEKIFCDYIAENIPTAKVDYIQIFKQNTLELLDKIEDSARVAVAVYVGKARLLDNIILKEQI